MELDYAQYSWILETLSKTKDPLAYFVQSNGFRAADVDMAYEDRGDAKQEWAKMMLALNKYCRFKK